MASSSRAPTGDGGANASSSEEASSTVTTSRGGVPRAKPLSRTVTLGASAPASVPSASLDLREEPAPARCPGVTGSLPPSTSSPSCADGIPCVSGDTTRDTSGDRLVGTSPSESIKVYCTDPIAGTVSRFTSSVPRRGGASTSSGSQKFIRSSAATSTSAGTSWGGDETISSPGSDTWRSGETRPPGATVPEPERLPGSEDDGGIWEAGFRATKPKERFRVEIPRAANRSFLAGGLVSPRRNEGSAESEPPGAGSPDGT